MEYISDSNRPLDYMNKLGSVLRYLDDFRYFGTKKSIKIVQRQFILKKAAREIIYAR